MSSLIPAPRRCGTAGRAARAAARRVPAVAVGVDERAPPRSAARGPRRSPCRRRSRPACSPISRARRRRRRRATSTGRKSRTYGRDHPQVALVARAARDDERVPVAEAGLQRGKLDPLREQAALVAQVPQRVLGERLQRVGDAPPLAPRARAPARARSSTRARRRGTSRSGRGSPPRTVSELAVGDLVEQVGAGRVDQADAAADELERPGVREPAGLATATTLTTTRTPDSTSSSAETRSRSAWSMIATSSGPRRLTRSFVRRSSRRGR